MIFLLPVFHKPVLPVPVLSLILTIGSEPDTILVLTENCQKKDNGSKKRWVGVVETY